MVTQTHTHNSPQQGSSHTQHSNTVHFQTPTPPSPHEIQTSTYTPAQNTPVQNVQSSLNINTIHPNPPSSSITPRHLSRPPLQPILTNPLSYNLTSTNSSHIQQSSTNNTRSNFLNTFPPSQMSNTIRPTLQYKVHNSKFQILLQPIFELIPTFIIHPPLLLQTFQMFLHIIQHHPLQYLKVLSQPTFINSSTSISEPIKPLMA